MKRKNRLNNIMNAWYKETGCNKCYNDSSAYHVHRGTIYIVSKKCGYFIGFHGQLIDKYVKILKKSHCPHKIKFIDIFCSGLKEF